MTTERSAHGKRVGIGARPPANPHAEAWVRQGEADVPGDERVERAGRIRRLVHPLATAGQEGLAHLDEELGQDVLDPGEVGLGLFDFRWLAASLQIGELLFILGKLPGRLIACRPFIGRILREQWRPCSHAVAACDEDAGQHTGSNRRNLHVIGFGVTLPTKLPGGPVLRPPQPPNGAAEHGE